MREFLLGVRQKGPSLNPDQAVPQDRLESLLCEVEAGITETGKALTNVNANVADMKQAVVEAIGSLTRAVSKLTDTVDALRTDAQRNTDAGLKAAEAVALAAESLEEAIRENRGPSR